MGRATVDPWRADESIFERIRDRILGNGDPTEEREDPSPDIPTPP
jgi:hypothetical protein